MAALSDYLENKVIDWLLRGQTFAPPATIYVGLFTTNANDANAGAVEVAGGSYARAAVTSSLVNWAGTQGPASAVASSGTSGTTSNNGAISFPAPTASWGTITGFATFDAATGGNEFFYAAMTTSKTVNSGDPAPIFPAAALSFQIDN